MLPHSNFGIRYRRGHLVSRFNPTKRKLQKQIDEERRKSEEEQDKGLIQKLLDMIKEF